MLRCSCVFLFPLIQCKFSIKLRLIALISLPNDFARTKIQHVHPYLSCTATPQGKSCFRAPISTMSFFFIVPISCTHYFFVAHQYPLRTVLVLALIPIAHSYLYRALIFHMHFSLCIAPCQSSICPHRAQ